MVSEIRFEVRKTPNRGILEISPKARPSPGGIHEKTDVLDLALRWGFSVCMALLGLKKMELGQNRTSNHPNGVSFYGLEHSIFCDISQKLQNLAITSPRLFEFKFGDRFKSAVLMLQT